MIHVLGYLLSQAPAIVIGFVGGLVLSYFDIIGPILALSC